MTEHEAGRKLDALVAEKVMGWVWRVDCETGFRWLESREVLSVKFLQTHWALGDEKIVPGWLESDYHDWRTNPHTLPPYSTDVTAAWNVLEKINNAYGITFVVTSSEMTGIEAMKQLPATFGYAIKIAIDAPTFPLAVCRAALAMKDVDTSSTS